MPTPTKDELKAEFIAILQGARPCPGTPPADLADARHARVRARLVAAMETRATGLGLASDFARYLAVTFGTDDARSLSDPDLRRAARWLDRCAAMLDAAAV